MSDYYKILGVEENASDEDIKKSYRSLAMKYHPDRNPGDHSAETKFKEVSEAYDTLSDPNKRKNYDNMRRFGGIPFGGNPSGSDGFSVNDVMREFFRNQSQAASMQGRDIQVDISCTLEESISGCKKSISFTTTDLCSSCSGEGIKKGASKVKCKTCNGRGKVSVIHNFGPNQTMQMVSECRDCQGSGFSVDSNDICKHCNGGLKEKNVSIDIDIPKHFVYGTALRIAGLGMHNNPKGNKGDCYIRIFPEKHELFELSNYDIVCMCEITMSEAIMGTKVSIPLPDGESGELTIPQGTSNGAQFIMGGRGLYKRGGGRGDSIVIISIETPKPTPEILKIAKKLSEEESADSIPKTTAFRKKIAKHMKKEKKNA